MENVSRVVAWKTPGRPLGEEAKSALARYFQTTPEFWLNLQAAYNLGDEDDEEGARSPVKL